MKVTVGSTNPVKIEATREAFKKIWPEKGWEVVGIGVVSGVRDQPLSDLESIKGATARAKRALKKTKSEFGVGIEGGLQKIGSRWFDSGWVVVVDKRGEIGIGSSLRMETPKAMLKLINEGKELGEVDDIIFGQKNSKQKEGHFGLMTKGAVKRRDGYLQAVSAALSRFVHPILWK